MFKNNKFRRFWNCLKKNKPALFGLIIIIFFYRNCYLCRFHSKL